MRNAIPILCFLSLIYCNLRVSRQDDEILSVYEKINSSNKQAQILLDESKVIQAELLKQIDACRDNEEIEKHKRINIELRYSELIQSYQELLIKNSKNGRSKFRY